MKLLLVAVLSMGFACAAETPEQVAGAGAQAERSCATVQRSCATVQRSCASGLDPLACPAVEQCCDGSLDDDQAAMCLAEVYGDGHS
jgi:hypothetical protein